MNLLKRKNKLAKVFKIIKPLYQKNRKRNNSVAFLLLAILISLAVFLGTKNLWLMGEITTTIVIWVITVALFGYIPTVTKSRPPAARSLHISDATSCFLAGALLIFSGCCASAVLLLLKDEHGVLYPVAFEGFATFMILMSAVTGGTLCADSLLGIEMGDNIPPEQVKEHGVLITNFALAVLLILVTLLTTFGWPFWIAFSLSAVVTTFVPRYIGVRPNTTEDDHLDAALWVSTAGCVLIVIGGASAFALNESPGSKHFIELFAKDFFPSYTSAIGACLLAKGLERNRFAKLKGGSTSTY